MAGSISVTPEQLQEISGQMSSGAANVEEILSRLAGTVAPLQSEWVGAAQAQFEALWDQWQTDAAGLHSALMGIAQLTQNAATSYDTTEQSIATSFTQA
jgi:WXG100 family type VII secretion target